MLSFIKTLRGRDFKNLSFYFSTQALESNMNEPACASVRTVCAWISSTGTGTSVNTISFIGRNMCLMCLNGGVGMSFIGRCIRQFE